MKVYILSLFFGKGDQESLILNFMEQLRDLPKEVEPEVKFGASGKSIMGEIPLDVKEYLFRRYPTLDVEEILQPVELPVKVYKSHKGDAIRFWLNWYVNFADNRSIALYIDGEGIPVREAWKHIRSIPEGGATISVRRTEDWGIGLERKVVEMYELWLVSRIFEKRLGEILGEELLPDGQCGLWSLSWRAASLINLRARAFEVELDLLTELLMKGIPIKFVEVEVEPADQTASKGRAGQTTFKKEDHEKKLLFLISKFKLNPDVLEEELADFSREVDAPSDVLARIEEVVRKVSSTIRLIPKYDRIYKRKPPIY